MVSSTNIVGHIHGYLGFMRPVEHRLDTTEKQKMDLCEFKGTVDMKGCRNWSFPFSNVPVLRPNIFQGRICLRSKIPSICSLSFQQSRSVPRQLWSGHCVSLPLSVSLRGTLPGRPPGDYQSFREQLAIVFLQKVPVPSQVQQPHRQSQVIVFQMLICKVALDQHRGYAARLGLLSGRP